MSRIGKKPVPVPPEVKVAVGQNAVVFEGPKGKSEVPLHPVIAAAFDPATRQLSVSLRDEAGLGTRELRRHRALWGTTRNLLANAIVGLTQGYTEQLLIVGVGYGARIEANTLILRVGLANELKVPIPAGVTVAPPQPGNIMITGIGQIPATTVTMQSTDKRLIGQFASSLRRLRPPEPYKGKGIRYAKEEVKRKAGKALAAGAK